MPYFGGRYKDCVQKLTNLFRQVSVTLWYLHLVNNERGIWEGLVLLKH